MIDYTTDLGKFYAMWLKKYLKHKGIKMKVHIQEGNVKFKITGSYFKKIGQEYSFQNPLYTMRTFPENVINPDGTSAYSTWTGGILGVTEKQLEDFNELNKKWYIE